MPSAGLQVVPVTTPAAHRDFCELPYRLHCSNACWVPPLRSSEDERWSPKHNASLGRRWCRRFLARRDRRVAGRIAAVIDEEFARRWAPQSGLFGFFECEDDPAVATALLEAVEAALRLEKRTRLLGPINLTTHDETGLLIAGHSSPPMVLSPYNPPYYEALVLGCGLAPLCDYYSYEWASESSHSPAVERLLRRLAPEAAARTGLALRHSEARRWDEDIRIIFTLYNTTFEQHWGFVPLTWDEFRQRADSFRPFYDPRYVLFAEIHGKPVGFAVLLPDVNEALARVGGRLWPFGWLRLLCGVRRLHGLRFILLGVLPEFTGAGIAVLLAHKAAATARRLGARRVELSVVLHDNSKVQHVITAFGGQHIKTYRLFDKAITP
jgi:GNAT superfamily N-acetyltransferase